MNVKSGVKLFGKQKTFYKKCSNSLICFASTGQAEENFVVTLLLNVIKFAKQILFSLGGSIAAAVELFNIDAITEKDTSGIKLEFGSAQALITINEGDDIIVQAPVKAATDIKI